MSNTTATLTSFASSQTSTLPFASHYYTDAPPLTAGCSSYNPLYKTSYSYNPSVAAGIIFTVLFTLSMIAHIGQSFWMRHYWLLVFAVGALTELIGWAARLWSAECVYNNTAFLMQISTLIIAPCFFTAGCYVILSRLIPIFGRNTSPLSPKLYLWIFCTCDLISIVIQAIGGGLASSASNSVPPANTHPGTATMVGGIVFQMFSIAIFTALFALVLFNARHNVISHNIKLVVAATTFAIILIFIRSVYRTIELSQGWSGYLIINERFFIALDGALMAAAVIVFNVVNPAQLLSGERAKDAPFMEGKGSPSRFHSSTV
ncbi:hypothetical protein MMC06_005205 [Schaereria dolodes]|nr:hypothetical protein [Schaereria dolodes]